MSGFSFSHLPGPQVLREFAATKAVSRTSDALLLAYLGEIDARNLFLDAGYSSMHAFLLGEFDFTHEVAKKRLRIARTAHKHPQILSMLSDGRLTFTSFTLLIPHINDANVDQLLSLASGSTCAELERVLASRFPTTELMSWTMSSNSAESTTTPEQNRETQGSARTLESTPASPTPQTSPSMPPLRSSPIPPLSTPRTTVTPTAAHTSGVQFMMRDDAQSDFDYLRAVLGHEAPTPEHIFALALKALRREVDKRKFSATDRPRQPRPDTPDTIDNSRRIPSHTRRAVFKRDQYRCTFMSEDGHRCEARSGLELDHVIPLARGGWTDEDNLRVLCRAHNQHAADRVFGVDFMNGKRAG